MQWPCQAIGTEYEIHWDKLNPEGGEDHDNVEEENDDQEIYRPVLRKTEKYRCRYFTRLREQ